MSVTHFVVPPISVDVRDWRLLVDVVPDREVVRVLPRGDLDLAGAPILSRVVRDLLGVGLDHIIIGLGGVEFLDVSGLRALLGLQELTACGDQRIEIQSIPAHVQRVAALAGTSGLLKQAGGMRR